jgi:hypothetical protein
VTLDSQIRAHAPNEHKFWKVSALVYVCSATFLYEGLFRMLDGALDSQIRAHAPNEHTKKNKKKGKKKWRRVALYPKSAHTWTQKRESQCPSVCLLCNVLI